MQEKCIQEFVVPRGRVPTEVSRAFQAVLVSLRNLEQKIQALPADSDELLALRKELENVKRTLHRTQQQQVRVVKPRAEGTRVYSSVFE